MIDFHCHILPALDDGAVTIDESIAMAKSLAAFGYKTVCCTPHCIKGSYELTPQKVREATLMLQADLDNADIRLELWPGMEYMLDECFAEFADELQPLGDTRLVLCEAPQQAHSGIVQQGLELIIEKGFIPLIAHPERTQYFLEMLRSSRDAEKLHIFNQEEVGSEVSASENFFKRFWPFASRVPRPTSRPFSDERPTSRQPSAARSALPENCLFQANLGSFTGYYGESAQRQAYELLKRGVYTALASDLHDGGAAAKVLISDKFDANPLLKKLAAFDGSVVETGSRDGAGQGELF